MTLVGREGETGKIPYVTRSSELPQMLHQDKGDVAGVGKVVGRLTQDSEVREREEETVNRREPLSSWELRWGKTYSRE